MNDFLEILISCVVLICAAALLRLIAKYRWLLVVTSLVWFALVRFVYRQGGNQGLIIVGVLTALLVITALILPWIGRLKVVLVEGLAELGSV
jgi:hypothetical protein